MPPMRAMIDQQSERCLGIESWRKLTLAGAIVGVLLLVGVGGILPVQAQGRRDDKTTGRVTSMEQLNPRMPPPLAIDPDRVEAAGIQLLRGRYIDLYSDIRDAEAIAEWVAVFDQAIPLWCQFFDIPIERAAGYRISGMIIADRNRPQAFRRAGLFPDDLPDFLAGFNRGHEFWVYLQPGDYYTRHLILHEGTHAFMQWFLGGSGPAWYSEGMAERLGLHRWSEDRLQLPWRVRSADECAYWGRVKRIRLEREAGRTMMLDQVLSIPPPSFRDVAAYAWSWAAVEFFANHPLSAERFDRLIGEANDTTERFNQRFRNRFSDREWQRLNQDWRVMIAEIEYGYGPELAAVQPARVAEDGSFAIRADRGWQTVIEVRAGQKLQIEAEGRVQVAREGGQRLESTAEGITVRYCRGEPLGRLQVGILTEDIALSPIQSGARFELTVPVAGTLCFRINDSAAELDDNRGELSVRVKKMGESD